MRQTEKKNPSMLFYPWANSHERWRRVSSRIAVLLLFTALTLIVTYPVITRMTTSLAQNPEWTHDGFHHTYVLWWFKEALSDLHTSPADLRLICFPSGGYYPLVLTYSTVYAVGLPLLLFLSPATVYNLLFLLTFLLSGLSGYALCTYLTRNKYAGILGGIVYAFFPNRMAHALSGHLELISTYLFPLYLLLLIKTVHHPRLTTSLLCGLALGGSLLVQPLFIPWLLAPFTLVWLLYESLLMRQSVKPHALLLVACAFGIAVLLAVPFFWPVLREQAQGQGEYLQDEGTVFFSADLLGILAPSPLNPFLSALRIVPPFAHNVVPTSWRIAELMTYAGIIPLTLSLAAVWGYRRRVGAWVILALTAAIFSLGPLLKVNGRLVALTTDNIESSVTLPYALLANLPLLSYNRAPARINISLMLAVSVLASYGLARVLNRMQGRWKGLLTVVLCTLTLCELLVIWPCPTAPLEPFTSLPDLATDDTGSEAVLNLPVSSWDAKELALFYQIQHQRPILDSWVQRSLRTSGDASEFLEGLLYPSSADDIVPPRAAESLAAITRAEQVSHIVLFTHYADNLPAQVQLLSDTFGPPIYSNDEVIIYRVPAGATDFDGLVYVLTKEHEGWWSVETWQGKPARWMAESAELYIYSPEEQSGTLQFTALPAVGPQRLQVGINDTNLPPLVIGDWTTYTLPTLTLRAGLNHVTLRALNDCALYDIDPRCIGSARASGADCNPSLHWNRCLSILVQSIRFLPDAIGPAENPIEAMLGDEIRFLGYDLQSSPTPGRPLLLNLYWQAVDTVEQDYIIFTHLLGPDQILQAQQDASPMNGFYPTSRWMPGDIFLYQASLEVPASIPPGRYELLVGMYTYPDINRLPVTADRPYAEWNLVWLQSVEIHQL